jgi:transposase-like protein
MPKSVHLNANAHLIDIWMVETMVEAHAALDLFLKAYGVENVRSVDCLTKYRADLLASHDFPLEHRKHFRTSNPTERAFTTAWHRTNKTEGGLSRQTSLAMTHQLMPSAKRRWRKLDEQDRLPETIKGVEYRNGNTREIKSS